MEAKQNGVFIGKDLITIDDAIMEILSEEHKFDKEKTIADLKRNKFNNATTTYYLILKKKDRARILKQQYMKDGKY